MHSLRTRLFSAMLAAALVSVAVALVIGVALTRSAIRDSIQQQVVREATVVAERIASVQTTQPDASKNENPGAEQQQPFRRPPGGRARFGQPPQTGDIGAIGSPGGRQQPNGGPAAPPQVFQATEAITLLPADAAARVTRGEAADGETYIEGEQRFFSARPIVGQTTFVLASRPTRVDSGQFNSYLLGLVLAALVAATLAAIGAALLARRMSKPILQVAKAAQTLASGEKPAQLPTTGTIELDALANSFNEMSTQLERAREAERSVLMSVSHELRTPLTAIRGYAEAIEDQEVDPKTAAAVIASESGRLERLVLDLLALARIDQGVLEVQRVPLELKEIAAEACRRLTPTANDEKVELRLESSPTAPALADSDRVLQVISNLIDNAIRVTPADGSVTVSVSPGVIVVDDTGPGIPDQHLAHTFERFSLRQQRGMGSTDGSGIGLSIVHELTQAMGGQVSVTNTPGSGARFEVRLPTA